MESIRLPYKQDIFGNDLFARIDYLPNPSSKTRKPIALIFHAGGLCLGSSAIVPQPQIDYLCNAGFVVVMPNYRLVPQVTAKEAFDDCEEAYDWSMKTLPGLLQDVDVDTQKIVVMGHSSGGTAAMHLASIGKEVKAALAFYPFLFVSTIETKQPTNKDLGVGSLEVDDQFSAEEGAEITPKDRQISEAPLRGMTAQLHELSPREKWTFSILKAGKWLQTLQPDGDFAAIDPMTRINGSWPAVRIVHGSEDFAPGRSPELMQRAGEELRKAGVDAQVEIVKGGKHLFDHGEGGDEGEKWEAVKRGLDFLIAQAA